MSISANFQGISEVLNFLLRLNKAKDDKCFNFAYQKSIIVKLIETELYLTQVGLGVILGDIGDLYYIILKGKVGIKVPTKVVKNFSQ